MPLNVAYMPVGILSRNIGTPVTTGVPAGTQPVVYMMPTTVPLSDYTIIGNTSSTQLCNAQLDPSGCIPVIPTFVYYAYIGGPTPGVPGLPACAVLARQFTNGLALFYTDTWGGSASFAVTSSPLIQLNGTYQRIYLNGSLSAPMTSIVLGGYEGAVFIENV